MEARWAVFFDTLGVKWEYEKEGFDLGKSGWYLPDFWLPDYGFWIEIKGQEPTEKEIETSRALFEETNDLVFIFKTIPDQGEPLSYVSCFDTWDAEVARVFPVEKPDGYIDNMFSSPECGGHDKWGIHLGCPICGESYVHIGKAQEIDGKDDYKAWQGRGDAVRIEMFCEMGHSWTVRLGFHKGFTYFDIEDCCERSYDPVALLSNNDTEKIERAYTAARSARFEHGEKPT